MRCFTFCSCDCIETNVKVNFIFYVRTRTYEERVTGKQPLGAKDACRSHSLLLILPCTCVLEKR